MSPIRLDEARALVGDIPAEAQVRLERMIGFGAGHRREDVDLVHVGSPQHAE